MIRAYERMIVVKREKITRSLKMSVLTLALCALMSFPAFADENHYIGRELAKQIALKQAGVSSSSVTFTKVKFDHDDGIAEYEIRFISGRIRYAYDINAQTGAVIGESKKTQKGTTRIPNPSLTQKKQRITLDEAKKIALQDAGVAASNATFIKAKLDKDDGRPEYEIEFVSGGKKYEYEIDARTGRIKQSEVESVEDDD